jgi:hypothetical protein
MFWFGLILGLSIGVIFHLSITKWFNKAKGTVKEMATDVKADFSKVKR